MKKSLIDKIKLLTELTCQDHHTQVDGYYSIEATYNAWSDKIEYVPGHDGYIWEVQHAVYDTYEKAESDLERQVSEQIEKEFKWAEDNLKDSTLSESWEFYTPLDSRESIDKYKKQYEELN